MPQVNPPTAESPDADPAPVISPAEAAVLAAERINAAKWWWRVALDLAARDERPVVLPVLAALEFSFSLAADTRDRARVEERWTWWRGEVEQAAGGESSHPLLLGLAAALDAGRFAWAEFRQLLTALSDDAGPRRYETWADLERATMATARALRIMLIRLTGAKPDSTAPIDHLIAAVLLTGRVRDLRDQFLIRDRLAAPLADWPVPDFEARLRESAIQGWGVDREILDESRRAVRATIERIWPWYEACEKLPESLDGLARSWCWFALHAGSRLLNKIEMWNAETALHRPDLAPPWRAVLRWRARRERTPKPGRS